MSARELRADAAGGELVGWVRGERGRRVLLLHGGPGLGYGYLEPLAEELAAEQVASYQQRGLAPSTTGGPFDVDTHVQDVGRVLDALGWDRVALVGHSWGGHLALHVAARLGERLDCVLCVDPLGGVGDGGVALFGAELDARAPADVRERVSQIDERIERGEATREELREMIRIILPAYFPRWEDAPPMPDNDMSVPCYSGTFESLHANLPALEAALGGIRVPVGFLVGASSPIPKSASIETAERIPGAWVEVIDGAAHFLWIDRPGCVRAALGRFG